VARDAPEARPGLLAGRSRRARVAAGVTVLAVIAAVAATVIGVHSVGHPPSSQRSGAAPPPPSQVVLPFIGLNHPEGVAVDGDGNLYVTDAGMRVLKLAVTPTTPTVLPFTGLNHPVVVGVDGGRA
jgi:serine/threonine-protein kinase